ncbi:MAG: lipopolysaccharide transport periplasmic protein LptA [Sulfurimonas sp.]|jgi:lipopolysaccharide export system protein LptA|nr:lipopolysaccharide transport periplasmic protein LptA [Sulfurimonas sp.]
MKQLLMISLLTSLICANELKIKANLFNTDQKTGVSIFEGDVNIQKAQDELNASKVTVYINENREPTKFVAQGNVSFFIVTEEGAHYKGKSQEAIYFPQKKEYHFFRNVNLKQLDDNKEITGDEVVLKSIEGTAYAKGAEKEPVIMIFNLKEKEKEAE